MANIYIKDELKERLEKLCEIEKRTQDGEIDFLVSGREKQLENDGIETLANRADNK